MTDMELDRLMRRALVDAICRDYETIEAADLSFEPSERFQQQMKAMLKEPQKWANRKMRPIWQSILQKVAIAFVACSLGLGSVMVVSSTARAAVLRWVTEWFETSVVFKYSGAQSIKQIPRYDIAEIPDGYFETDRIELASAVSVYYESENGGVICFDYNYMHQGSMTIMTMEDNNVSNTTVHGLDGVLFLPTETKGTTTLTWIDPELNIQFTIDTTLGVDSALHMAESVSEVKDKVNIDVKAKLPAYAIIELPKGYAEAEENSIQMPEYVRIQYENKNNQWLVLRYVFMQEGTATIIDFNGDRVQPVTVNGCVGYLFGTENYEEAFNTITWVDEEAGIQFTVDGNFDEAELLRIAESVSEIKNGQ